MIEEETERRFDSATEALDEFFRELIGVEGFELEMLSILPLEHFLIQISPGIDTHASKSGGVFYTVQDSTGAYLGGAAQRLPEAHSVVVQICASNVFEGAELPASLRSVAHMMILGQFPAATRRGPSLGSDFMLRYGLRSLAIFARDAFGLALTRSDGPTTLSACDAVCMVANQHGLNIPYTRLRDWCSHGDHSEFRNRADAVSNYLKDLFLAENGILKNEPTPFGVFSELSRMRRI